MGHHRQGNQTSGFQILLKRWERAEEECLIAYEFSDRCYEFPDRPDLPSVKLGEMKWTVIIGHGSHTVFYSEATISEVFDSIDQCTRLQDTFCGEPLAQTPIILARNDIARQNALLLFRERKQARNDWEALSGYATADEILGDKNLVARELEIQLRDCHPTTIIGSL